MEMTVEALVREIAKWVSQNSHNESVFLTPAPETNVNAHDLLDHISEITGIDKETIGKWCD